MRVSDILRSKAAAGVETVSPKEKVARVATVLSGKKIGTVVVSTDGKSPDGILSERDIVRELGKRGEHCLTDVVDSLMTSEMVTCSGEETADQVLRKMTDGRFRHMPVMEGDNMVGLISIGDVVKARLSQLSMEKNALEDMIKGF